MKRKKRIIVFAPHFDDETLGCGGTIAKKLSEGNNVSVVFMTDGRHALTERGILSEPTPSELKEIRRREAVKATKILGLREEENLFLDVEDKTLYKHKRKIQERIVEILRNTSPAEVYYPQEKERNIDHRSANMIIRNALASMHACNIHPLEYQYVIFWSYPFNLIVHASPERVFDYFLSKFLRRNLIRIDISNFLHLKKMALKEYESQMTVLSNRQTRPVVPYFFLKRFLKDEEKFFLGSSSYSQ